MWPFGEKWKGRDAVREYKKWLRRWLLEGHGRYAAAGILALALAAGSVYAVVNMQGNMPAFTTNTVENDSTYRLEDKQVKDLPKEDNPENKPNKIEAMDIKTTPAAVEADREEVQAAMPVQGTKTSSYGFRYSPVYEDYRFHSGIELQAADGTVQPCLPGEVTAVQGGPGNYKVEMTHDAGFTSIYEGLDSVNAAQGDKLKKGDILGDTGGSGEKGKITFTLKKDGKPVNPGVYMD